MQQQLLGFRKHGGARKGAGRKKTVESRTPHRTREKHNRLHSQMITQKICEGLPSMRQPETAQIIFECFWKASDRFGVRITHFVVMQNHFHLVIEGESKECISKAMQGLFVRLARNLNKYWGRKGKLFPQAYDQSVLTCPTKVRNAIAYVLGNARRHGITWTNSLIDPYSSARWFEHWLGVESLPQSSSPVAQAQTWMQTTGAWKWGPLDPRKRPGPKPGKRGKKTKK